MLRAGFRLLLLLCRFRLGQILGRDTFTGVGNNIRSARYFGYLHINANNLSVISIYPAKKSNRVFRETLNKSTVEKANR